ncbi:MAG: hypothetical protein HOE78_18960 [Gammaproteobacteria bacterium]|nr:hypothetical protein [Gammaproteobacteria bacterium]
MGPELEKCERVEGATERSVSELNGLLYGRFERDEHEEKLFEYAEQYHKECEAYDETVCTGPPGRDGVMPGNDWQLVAINKNALQVRKRILADAESNGFGKKEVITAIHEYRG